MNVAILSLQKFSADNIQILPISKTLGLMHKHSYQSQNFTVVVLQLIKN